MVIQGELRSEDPLDFVVANFMSLESELISCMEYVPFVEANRGVVSPKFAPILFEACSLIESIFRHMDDSSDKKSFRGFAALFENRLDLKEATTLFLVSPLAFLQPFQNWTEEQPSWWSAYNKMKHDRISNYSAASYTHTVLALAGLHQVIARSWMFLGNLAKAGWFNTSSENFAELMASRAAGSGPPDVPVETKLFVSPIRDSFVSYEEEEPCIEDWEFSMRVKVHIWEYEGV